VNGYPLSPDDASHRIAGVFDVADLSCPGRASLDTGRLQAAVNPVITKITFIRHMVDRMEKSHAVRAGHNAVTAADAPLPIHQHNTISSLVSCAHRTYLDAGRLCALVAELGNEKSLFDFFRGNVFEFAMSQIDPAGGKSVPRFFRCIGEYVSLRGYNIPFNPGPGDIRVKGDFVFQFAGLDAETAADALIGIDKKYETAGRRRGLNIGGPENSVQSPGQHNDSGSFRGQYDKIPPVHFSLLPGFEASCGLWHSTQFNPGLCRSGLMPLIRDL